MFVRMEEYVIHQECVFVLMDGVEATVPYVCVTIIICIQYVF